MSDHSAATRRWTEVVHGNDEGGLLGEYVEKYQAMAARGDTLVVDGACNSACTLALGIVDVCATPRASFGFHMAQSMTLFGYFPSYYWSRYMMAHYPPEIRAWIVSKGGLTPDLKILRGEELAALVPTCPSEGPMPEESQSQPDAGQRCPGETRMHGMPSFVRAASDPQAPGA